MVTLLAPREPKAGVLLTTADRQTEAMMGKSHVPSSFADSLYQSIIFYEGTVVPDIFAFISSELDHPAGGANRNDFATALKNGLITPAFRGQAKTFEQALEIIRDQKIKGVQPNAHALALYLDGVRKQANNSAAPRPWEASSSQIYGKRMTQALRDIVSINSGGVRVRPNLSITAEFIASHNILAAVEEEIAGNSNGELKRGFLLDFVLKKLNSIQDSGLSEFDDASSLVDHPAVKESVSAKIAVQNLVSVSNLIYHDNMAASLNTSNYLSRHAYHNEVLDVADVAMRIGSVIDAGSEIGDSPVEEIHKFDVKIPTMMQLQTVGLEKLLSIREKHVLGYFSQLQSWQRGMGTPQAVKESLIEYCNQISKDVNIEAPLAKVVMRPLTNSARAGMSTLGRGLVNLSEDPGVRAAAAVLSVFSSEAAGIVFSWTFQNRIVPHSRNVDAVV